jgi:hypothetical protein
MVSLWPCLFSVMIAQPDSGATFDNGEPIPHEAVVRDLVGIVDVYWWGITKNGICVQREIGRY